MVRPNPRQYGDIVDVDLPVGLMFADRADLYESGLHGTKESGIFGTKHDQGAFSIVLNAAYEDDVDEGDRIVYTGEGKGKLEPGDPQETAPKKKNVQLGDQDMNSTRNAALRNNMTYGNPVRVIRGPDGNDAWCPRQGYRYDGLYDVVRAWMEEGKAGFKMCRFELRRCTSPQQPPLPVHITGEGADDLFWSVLHGREALNRKERRKSPRTLPTFRSIEERNREITGNRRIPPGLSFKKKSSTCE